MRGSATAQYRQWVPRPDRSGPFIAYPVSVSGYDGVLFDHDGVLVELCSESVLHAATRQAFRDVGVTAPSQEDIAALAIRVSPEQLTAVADRYDVNADRLWERREAHIERRLRAETRAGRKAPHEDVDALAALSLPLGVVSNNQTRIVEFVLNYHGLADRFGTIHAREPTRQSLHRKKPAPWHVEQAVAALDCTDPLYVGDSESDVRAGQRAGIDVAFLRRDHNNDRRLDVSPTYDIESLRRLATLV
ncbi:HAD family hydrolase [Halosegnis sp.]|uniref:HAD family hydrolase n=1 Tax=Halosegnis sp. TaxID=2864959 RepID=UPI0035D3DB0F